MSTRGVYGYKLDGKFYVTYNHSDSYPKGGLGEKVVRFCSFVNRWNNWEFLAECVRNLKLVDVHSVPTPEQIEKYRDFADTGVSTGSITDWYCLMRGLQYGGYLEEFYGGKIEHMIDSLSFMQDGLFCEYGYVINLDDMKLDFYTSPPFPDSEDDYPLTLRARFDFDKLPVNWL